MVVPKTIDSGAEAPLRQVIAHKCLFAWPICHSAQLHARPAFKTWWTRVSPQPIELSTYVLFSSLLLFLLFRQWRSMPGVVWNAENSVACLILLSLYWIGWLLVILSTFMIDHFEFFGLRQVYLYLRNEPSSDRGFRTPALCRCVRHPVMLWFIIAFWAMPRMTAGHLALASAGYIHIALQFEESDLVSVYGDAHTEYKRQVPALLPLPGKKR